MAPLDRHNGTLYKVDKAGEYTEISPGWDDTVAAMAAMGEIVFIVCDDALYKVDKAGAYSDVSAGYADTRGMAAVGDRLWVVSEGTLCGGRREGRVRGPRRGLGGDGCDGLPGRRGVRCLRFALQDRGQVGAVGGGELDMLKVKAAQDYRSRCIETRRLELEDGSRFKAYVLEITGRANPERYEWRFSKRPPEQALAQLGHAGVSGIGIPYFPHFAVRISGSGVYARLLKSAGESPRSRSILFCSLVSSGSKTCTTFPCLSSRCLVSGANRSRTRSVLGALHFRCSG